MAVEFVTGDKLQTLLQEKGQSVVVVDVRDSERAEDGHIKGSVHYPSSTFANDGAEQLKQHVAESGKTTVVFHCALSQVRGPKCARHFASIGVDPSLKVLVLERGFNGWHADGKPVCTCAADVSANGQCSC